MPLSLMIHYYFDPNERTLEERLERWLYVGDDRHIVERYVAGQITESSRFSRLIVNPYYP